MNEVLKYRTFYRREKNPFLFFLSFFSHWKERERVHELTARTVELEIKINTDSRDRRYISVDESKSQETKFLFLEQSVLF